MYRDSKKDACKASFVVNDQFIDDYGDNSSSFVYYMLLFCAKAFNVSNAR